MKFGTVSFIISLVILAVAVGGIRFYYIPKYYPQLLKSTELAKVQKDKDAAAAQQTATPSAQPVSYGSISTVSAQLLKDLTPRQKVAQLIAAPVVIPTSDKGDSISSAAATIQNEVPGFITLFGQKASALVTDRLNGELKKIPIQPRMVATQPTLAIAERQFLSPLIVIDHEGGSVQRLSGEGMTELPSAEEQCKLDRESLKSVLDRAAKELHGVGIDIVFGPVVDLGTNHPVLKTRLCSSDVDLVRTYGGLWVEAMQAQQVIPVIKHFPGIGQTTVDLHKKSEAIILDPIQRSVFIGMLSMYPHIGVMTTHVSLKTTDGSEPVPCTISTDCVKDLQVDAPHLVFTDGLEMASAQGSTATPSATPSLKQSLSSLSIQAVEAGHNVVVLGKSVKASDIDQVVGDMADRYQRNPVFKQKVDQALRVIWQAKFDHWSALGTIQDLK